MQLLSLLVRIWLDNAAFQNWLDSHHSTLQSVTIIVPVLNEGLVLEGLIQLLHTLQPAPKEVIFVDGGSADRCGPASNSICTWHL
jgi:cellulose synthase/poly-beta-1,6-N-acetylglucosamine synthase-like glycosyltransferase